MESNKELYLGFKEYLETAGYSKSSKQTYDNHIRHLYSYAEFYDMQLTTFGTIQMIGYKKQLLSIYSANTINNKLSAVRIFFDYLMQINVIDRNPVFNALFIKIDKVRPQFLSIEDRLILMDFLGTKGNHIQLAYNIMIYAGLRLSEVCKIKIADIEFRNGNAFIHVADIKTNKLRLCPVFDRATSEAIKNQIMSKALSENLIIVQPRTLQYYASQFAAAHSIKFSVHTCRHIFATERVRGGMRLELLKTIMGHKSINTTLMYIYIAEDEIYALLS